MTRFNSIGVWLLVVAAFPNSAIAACRADISGPYGNGSKYYYSSSCFEIDRTHTLIRQQVCSVSSSTVVFTWTKLNWVSGSSGIEFGGCLVRENQYSHAIRVGGSKITANVAPPQDTEVYLPDLGKGNKVYWESINGGGPRVESGTREPFHFEIQYAETAQKVVKIRATMVGRKPVFYFVLPRTVKNQGDLKAFINDDYISKISSLVKFGDKPIKASTSSKDTMLAEFYKNNNFANRGSVIVQGQENRASLEFVAMGDLKDVVDNSVICIGQGNLISTCFGNATN